MKNQFAIGWLLCALLDAIYATGLTALQGGDVAALWRRVASGPLGDNVLAWGDVSVALGIFVHLSIMAAMVGSYAIGHRRISIVRNMHPVLAGTIYGASLYLVMYNVILPLRWPEFYPLVDPIKIALGILPHIVLVGLPVAWILNRDFAQANQRIVPVD